ncbi:MAG: hypothetical protein IT458_05610 [Planctomycetes bacterium]|nr:hypothetical protein [Planctomycetota bacterium]
MQILPTLAAVLPLLVLAPAAQEPPRAKPAPGPATGAVAAGSNSLGARMLAELLGKDPAAARNVCVAPASIAVALGMLWNGASGESAARLGRLLGYEGMSAADVNRGCAALLAGLSDRGGVSLRSAQGLWLRQGVQLDGEYLARMRAHFAAEVTTADFSRPETLLAINSWVKARTAGRIPEVLDRIPADAVLYLINAIYLNAPWLDPFEAKWTEDRPFQLVSGASVPVPTMVRNGEYAIHETKEWSALRLPYADRRTSMVVLLPGAGRSVSDVAASLPLAEVLEWVDGGRVKRGRCTVQLPRLHVEWGQDVLPVLQRLGVADLADPEQADLSGLGTGIPLFVSRVLHRTWLEVNEAGTEAAAATVVEARAGGRPKIFAVDRPFVFLILDEAQRLVLFAGAIVDPRA